MDTASTILAEKPEYVSEEMYEMLQWPNTKWPHGLRTVAGLIGVPEFEHRDIDELYGLVTNVRSGICRLLAIRYKGLKIGQKVMVNGTGLQPPFEGVIETIRADGRVLIKGKCGAYHPVGLDPIR